MKKRLSSIAVFAALGLCAVAASAEEQYQSEISAVYGRTDYSQDFRVTTIGAMAEVFFAPVNTTGHPYAEAAFLERAGSVIVTASDIGLKASLADGDGRVLRAGVNYAKPDFPLAVQATYGKTKYDYDAPYNYAYEGNDYSIRVGNYFTRTLLAGVNYANSKIDESTTGFSMKSKDVGIFAHYVNELGQGTALSLDGSLLSSTSDDGSGSLRNTVERVSVDYFFSRGLSAGVGIENSSGKDLDNEGRTYSANVRYFVSPRLSFLAMYDRSLAANAGSDDTKSVVIVAALRF